MSIFRRRNGFDRTDDPVPSPTDDRLNLTNYVERTVIPTDAGYGYTAPATEPLAATTTAVSDFAETAEQPMVFASREHSGIYIYEYSDRLEYYVRTATCMHKFDTVKKSV